MIIMLTIDKNSNSNDNDNIQVDSDISSLHDLLRISEEDDEDCDLIIRDL